MRVLVFGTFDHLHPGHRFLLNRAQERGELFVVVAHDATVKRVKGFYPDQNQSERKEAIECDYPMVKVLFGDRNDYLAPIREVEPDLILLGYDQELPPGISEADIPCSAERIEAFKPEIHKSSHIRGVQ